MLLDNWLSSPRKVVFKTYLISQWVERHFWFYFSSFLDSMRLKFLKLLVEQKCLGTDIIIYQIVCLCIHFSGESVYNFFLDIFKGRATTPPPTHTHTHTYTHTQRLRAHALVYWIQDFQGVHQSFPASAPKSALEVFDLTLWKSNRVCKSLTICLLIN